MSDTDTAAPVALLHDYLTPDQLAGELHVSLRTLRRWEARREGPPYVKIGNQRLYRRASVDAWLASREKSAERAEPRRRRVAR